MALTWAQVDFAAGIVRLEPNTTKSDQGRVFPFGALPELAALLQCQREQTSQTERRLCQVIPYVFHRNGNLFELSTSLGAQHVSAQQS